MLWMGCLVLHFCNRHVPAWSPPGSLQRWAGSGLAALAQHRVSLLRQVELVVRLVIVPVNASACLACMPVLWLLAVVKASRHRALTRAIRLGDDAAPGIGT
jgi:hypothetical protein